MEDDGIGVSCILALRALHWALSRRGGVLEDQQAYSTCHVSSGHCE